MPFDAQPVLSGELVVLRPLRADDLAPLYAVAADPLIWAQHPARDRHEAPVFRRFFDAAARREVEIGWTFLARSHWGGRYNGEMKRLMLAHAFRSVDRVVFLVGPENVRSRRAVERIGGVRAGTRADAAGRESVLYEITAAAFAGGPNAAAPPPRATRRRAAGG